MATKYPAAIDNNISLPPVQDLLSPIQAKDHNELRDTVVGIEATLGVKPQGIYTNVRSRLDYLENLVYLLTGISPPLFNFVSIGGDLSGAPNAPTVSGFYNIPLNNTNLQDGYAYVFDGYSNTFIPQPVIIGTNSGSGGNVPDASPTLKGVLKLTKDLGGTADFPLVTGLQNVPISSVPPTTGYYLYYDGTQAVWAPLYQQDVQPIFALTLAVSGSSVYDVGRIITNPAFTSTTNYNPLNSAQLTNNDNAENKNVLAQVNSNTVFTSNAAYTRNTVGASITFTLTGINAANVTKTAQTSISFVNRLYYGQGLPNQSTGPFITSLQSNSLTNNKNITFSVNAANTNSIYFAYRTALGTSNFTDIDTGFPFAMNFVANNIPVTNAYGVTENFTLYESANVGLGLSNIKVT